MGFLKGLVTEEKSYCENITEIKCTGRVPLVSHEAFNNNSIANDLIVIESIGLSVGRYLSSVLPCKLSYFLGPQFSDTINISLNHNTEL